MTLQDKAELLRRTDLFTGLNDEELAHIASVSQEIEYQPHELIIEQGQKGDSAYIIFSGNAKVYTLSVEGKEIPLNLIREGDLCGEMALFDGEPRSASVEALTHIKALRITKEELFSVLDTHVDITHKLLATLSRRIRLIDSAVEDLHTTNTVERTLHVLMSLKSSFNTSDIPLTHEELALLTGITRPRLTEALHTLEAEGKILLSHKNIHIL